MSRSAPEVLWFRLLQFLHRLLLCLLQHKYLPVFWSRFLPDLNIYLSQDLNLYVAMLVMAIAVALISIFSRSWYVIPAGVVFIAVLYMMMMRNRTRMLNALSRALEEQYPEGMAEMSIAFGSDGLHQLNQTTGDLTVLPYDNLTDVIEGEDSMALLTRANALIPVFTSQLTESEKEHLLALLAEKAPKCKQHRA